MTGRIVAHSAERFRFILGKKPTRRSALYWILSEIVFFCCRCSSEFRRFDGLNRAQIALLHVNRVRIYILKSYLSIVYYSQTRFRYLRRIKLSTVIRGKWKRKLTPKSVRGVAGDAAICALSRAKNFGCRKSGKCCPDRHIMHVAGLGAKNKSPRLARILRVSLNPRYKLFTLYYQTAKLGCKFG